MKRNSKKKSLPQIEAELKRLCDVKYPVEVHWMDEPETKAGYYLVFLPDFGHSACSATGESIQEALNNLAEVKQTVLQHYLESGITVPGPSGDPTRQTSLQQMPLRIPRDLHRRLRDDAQRAGLSLNTHVLRLLSEHSARQSIVDALRSEIDRLLEAPKPSMKSASPARAI